MREHHLLDIQLPCQSVTIYVLANACPIVDDLFSVFCIINIYVVYYLLDARRLRRRQI